MYQIVTDSCCDLPYQVLQAAKVDYLSMKIQLDEEELVDDLGKTFNYDHYMEQLRNGATPTTSQINVGQYLEFFRPYVEQNLHQFHQVYKLDEQLMDTLRDLRIQQLLLQYEQSYFLVLAH